MAGQLPLFGPATRFVRRTRRSTDEAVRALRGLGRLESTDVARVAMLRTIADLIDDELTLGADANKWTIARLTGEWRALFAELLGSAGAALDAELAAFFTEDDAAGVGRPPVLDPA